MKKQIVVVFVFDFPHILFNAIIYGCFNSLVSAYFIISLPACVLKQIAPPVPYN